MSQPSDTPDTLRKCTGFGLAYRSELDETDIIRRYVPIVKRMAIHLKGRLPEKVQLDDLIQAGLIAVLRITRNAGAVQTGDALLNRSITNAMIDEARREAWAPVRTVRLAKDAGRAMRAAKRRLGRDGSDEEIAAEMGISLEAYWRVLTEIAGIELLNLHELDSDGEEPLRVGNNQEKLVHRTRMLDALAESIASLPEREKLVVSLYYEHTLNMEEVGRVLGLNKSTICRAHGRALLMLRNALADWGAATGTSRQARGE